MSRRAPWLVALGLLPVYLLTLHHAHGWDSIAYTARSVGDPLLSERYLSSRLFHPHHLLYVPLLLPAQALAAALRGAAFAAPAGEAAFTAPMVLNALLGALSAGLAGALAGRLGASPLRAFAVALAVGVSNAVWRYATEVEVMVPALCALLLAAWVLAAAGPRTRGQAVLAGLALAAASLLHELAVPFALAATVVVAAEARRARRAARGPAAAPRTHFWLFAAAWIVPVKLAYLTVGLHEARARTIPALLDWALAARGRSTFATHGPLHALRETLRAAAESLVSLRPLADARHEPVLAVAAAFVALWALAVGLFAAPALARALAARAAAPDPRATGLRALALGLALTVAFVAWFQPWNDDYWVYMPPLAIVLVAATAPRGWIAGRALFVAALALLAAVNLVAAILPATAARRASYADLLEFAREASLQRGDVLFSGGTDTAIGEGIVALPMFTGVRVVPAPDAVDLVRFRGEAWTIFSQPGTRFAYATREGFMAVANGEPPEFFGATPLPVRLRGAPVYRLRGDFGASATPMPRPRPPQ